MIRLLSIIIAVLAGVIGWLTDSPWLYLAAAGVVLIGVLASLGLRRSEYRRERSAAKRAMESRANSSDDDLSSLGISNVRPKTKTVDAADASDALEEAPADEPDDSRRELDSAQPAASGSKPAPTLFDSPRTYPGGVPDATGAGPRKEFEQILLPYLQSLQAACGAHSALLLEVDSSSDQYRVAGVASRSGYIRRRARFARSSHFISRLPAEEPVYELPVDGKTLRPDELEYYSEPVAVAQVVAAPVTTSSGIVGYLIVDSLSDGPLITKANHETVVDYAHLLGRIMEARQIAPRSMASSKPSAKGEGRERPRKEIIAEEIEAARNRGAGLALALVYLDDAEHIAQQGSEAVRHAEQALAAYLKQETDEGRVERFGELMFGVFHRGAGAGVDTWAQRVQESIARGDGAPARGRVSIGVAILSDRHRKPEDLREDATNALREAFETGDCIILE